MTLNSLLRLTNLWPSDSGSNLNFEMLVFEQRGKPEYQAGEKPLGARTRINDKLNPHMTLSPGIEPGPHWWEASALPLRHPRSRFQLALPLSTRAFNETFVRITNTPFI